MCMRVCMRVHACMHICACTLCCARVLILSKYMCVLLFLVIIYNIYIFKRYTKDTNTICRIILYFSRQAVAILHNMIDFPSLNKE